MKKLKIVLGVLLILIVAPVVVFGAFSVDDKNTQAEEIVLYYNGLQLEQKGLRLSGEKVFPIGGYDHNIYVPIRTFSIMKGKYAVVSWEGEESRATLYMEGDIYNNLNRIAHRFVIGSRIMESNFITGGTGRFSGRYNGSLMPYDAFLYEGATMIPFNVGNGFFYAITGSEGLPDYYENKLCYYENSMEGGIYIALRNHSTPEDCWWPLKSLASSKYALISNENGIWSLSILKQNGEPLEEGKYLLGDNFEFLYYAGDDMRFDCNGLRIKKENGYYFLNEADLIGLGVMEQWRDVEESSEEFKGMTFEFIPAD